MTEADRKRANSLLVTLLLNGGAGQARQLRDELEQVHGVVVTLLPTGGAGQARQLRDELEQVHGVVVTLDRVRQDLNNLHDLGLIQKVNDTVALTQEGRETAQGTRKLP